MAEQIYNLKIIECGSRMEIYKYQGYVTTGKESTNATGRGGKAELSEEQKANNKKDSRVKVLNEARNKIVRLISCNPDMQTFITITYKDNFQDLKKSKEHIRIFFKKLRVDYPNIKYLYVLEFQERGAIHYHILSNIKIDIPMCRSKKSQKQKDLENYFKKHYWSNRGFVDIRRLDIEGISNVAKYVSAYLVKDLLSIDLQGNKIYGYSKNLNKPKVTTIETKDNTMKYFKLEGYNLQYSNSYERVYINKEGKEVRSQVNYFDYLKENSNENWNINPNSKDRA